MDRLSASAHSLGAHPFGRSDYVRKLRTLSEGIAETEEVDRFLGLVDRLPELQPEEVGQLNVVVPADRIDAGDELRVGIL